MVRGAVAMSLPEGPRNPRTGTAPNLPGRDLHAHRHLPPYRGGTTHAPDCRGPLKSSSHLTLLDNNY
ncbi:hypothetical protein E2562_017812 [Oryza meyeriana var. granulata]|uniref:Uncharacterized protein n=1 Tax=Oryza meyeriana var. granulata TaxID=110450 RepID=A0A6G1BLA3_9ORYZ|nr:hypothetical protein E2562_017812 [Oryza meyeriana var. granulata]